mgnify:CR=1 FL=1
MGRCPTLRSTCRRGSRGSSRGRPGCLHHDAKLQNELRPARLELRENAGDDGGGRRVDVNLEVRCRIGQEVCFEERHLSYFLGLTLPQILLYIIGLPVAAFVLLRRNKERIIHQDMSFHMRYGFLFYGYRLEWWESVTASRKVVVVLIGTLGTLLNSVYMQAFLALLVIFVSIFIHLSCEPFDVGDDSGRLLHRLELGALTMNFLTFWGGYVQRQWFLLVVLGFFCLFTPE